MPSSVQEGAFKTTQFENACVQDSLVVVLVVVVSVGVLPHAARHKAKAQTNKIKRVNFFIAKGPSLFVMAKSIA